MTTVSHQPGFILRHKTAIRRHQLSRPVHAALDAGLISGSTGVFDYGCGHGGDIQRLNDLGIQAVGWDPYFSPMTPRIEADVVNLGFVLNVIEDRAEREEALRAAWALTGQVLLVSVRTLNEVPDRGRAFRDGLLTSRSTFQKYFDHVELINFVEGVLSERPVSVEHGIVAVFRSPQASHDFLATRFRRRTRSAPISQATRLYDEYREAFDLLLQFWTEHGRGPRTRELEGIDVLEKEVGSVRRVIQVLRRIVGQQTLGELAARVHEDLLVFLALDRFGGRPKLSDLSQTLQWDIKAQFSSYKRACDSADNLLFTVGNPMLIDAECRDSQVGKLTPNALYIHRSALDDLTAVLRVYEGCARVMLGELPDANVIKFRRDKAKVSYLTYNNFDRDAHPALQTAITVGLRSLNAKYRSYRESLNPPILHRKETLVPEDYPGRDKFRRLTKREERLGLYEDVRSIGTRDGWASKLREQGVKLRGHQATRVQR